MKTLLCLAVAIAALAAALAAPSAGGSQAAPCLQRIVVEAPRDATTASLRLTACGKTVSGPWTARVGWAGLSANRREGDGTTPVGTFGIGDTMYGAGPDPGVHFRYHRIVCGDYWVEDARSPAYNTFQHYTCGTKPPFMARDGLWQKPRPYRHLAFIRYNAAPVVAGRGSAIFLHVSSGDATNGCVSLPLPQLVKTLRWLRPGAKITIRFA